MAVTPQQTARSVFTSTVVKAGPAADPTNIGPYRVERRIAKGGMATVYLCRDASGNAMAVKVFWGNTEVEPTLVERFGRECQALTQLRHPNVVNVYDVSPHSRPPYIAMEYVEGGTLATLLQRQPDSRLTWPQARGLFLGVLAALEEVRCRGIVHRDVKPENILVDGGRAKLSDFGIALVTGLQRQTREGSIGTPKYMSTEHLREEPLEHSSDIYSAGAVLYRMLAGRPPFDSDDFAEQLMLRRDGAVPPLPADVPTCISDAVAIALRNDPKERFATAGEFAEQLRDAEEGLVPVVTAAAEAIDAHALPASQPTVPNVPPPPHKTRPKVSFWVLVTSTTVIVMHIVYAFHVPLRVEPRRSPEVRHQSVDRPLPVPPRAAPPAADIHNEASALPPEMHAPERRTDTAAEERKREAERMRKIAQTQAAIEEALTAIDALVASGDLERARAALIPVEAQSAGDEFLPQRTHIELIHSDIDRRVLDAKEKQLVAKDWERRLRAIDAHTDAGEYPEAISAANRLAEETDAPPDIADRARRAGARARDTFRELMAKTDVGPTTNTIRKPSTPPRN